MKISCKFIRPGTNRKFDTPAIFIVATLPETCKKPDLPDRTKEKRSRPAAGPSGGKPGSRAMFAPFRLRNIALNIAPSWPTANPSFREIETGRIAAFWTGPFQAPHRDLSVALEDWYAAHLPVDHTDVNATCKGQVAALGQAGFLRHSGADAGEALDARSLCLIRETLARHHPLVDFTFALQGLGMGRRRCRAPPASANGWIGRARVGRSRPSHWPGRALARWPQNLHRHPGICRRGNRSQRRTRRMDAPHRRTLAHPGLPDRGR